jgi:hypothetical protein
MGDMADDSMKAEDREVDAFMAEYWRDRKQERENKAMAKKTIVVKADKNPVVHQETELVVVDTQPGELSVESIKHQVAKIKQLMADVMVGPSAENPGGVHYGVIPGTHKPTLLKPGAEKVCLMFRLRVIINEGDITITDYEGGHREYRVLAHIMDHNGQEVATGVGACTTMEGRYRYRWDNTRNPVPREYWTHRDSELLGGSSFAPRKIDGEWIIFRRIEHDNPADYFNTCLKISKKRAHVDGCITATACSELFTQDVEEMAANEKASGRPSQFDQRPQDEQEEKKETKKPDAAKSEPKTEPKGQFKDGSPKLYELTDKHKELKKLVHDYVEAHCDPTKVTYEDAFAEILSRLSTWPGHPGVRSLDRFSAKMAENAIGDFKKREAENAKKKGRV